MIREKSGDLLAADSEAMVNAVNTVGVMGKGIALQFKQTYPDMFREYAQAARGRRPPDRPHVRVADRRDDRAAARDQLLDETALALGQSLHRAYDIRVYDWCSISVRSSVHIKRAEFVSRLPARRIAQTSPDSTKYTIKSSDVTASSFVAMNNMSAT